MRAIPIATILYFLAACSCRNAGTSPSDILEKMHDKDSLVILMNTRSCSSDALSKLIIHKEKGTYIADYYSLHDKSVHGRNIINGSDGKLTQSVTLDSNDQVAFKRFVRELLGMRSPSCTIFTIYTIHSPYWNTEVTVDECFKNDLDKWYMSFMHIAALK